MQFLQYFLPLLLSKLCQCLSSLILLILVFFFTSFLEISAVGSQSLPKSNQEWCWGAGVLCAVTPCVLPSEPPWGCAGADLSISCYSIIVHNNVVTLSVQLFAFDQDMEKETVIWEHIFFPFFFPSEEQQVVQI